MYYLVFFLFLEHKKQVAEENEQDFYEYTRGRKIPPEGIPGFDFSDPESIVEFTKYVHVPCCVNQ